MANNLPSLSADEIIQLLRLEPHPEGGHYRETFRDNSGGPGRGLSTAIYFLLKENEISHWHRIDAAEIWHWYAGDPLQLLYFENNPPDHAQQDSAVRHVLGSGLAKGEQPQAVVPPHSWQSAKTLGAWTLAGCTVAPGFEFSKFELAPKSWTPR